MQKPSSRSLFRQSGELTCGPTALAYALTLMGDDVFGEQLAAAIKPADPRGYSFAELQRLAIMRGFTAEGYQGSLKDLPGPGSPPVMAHMRMGHYVVVLSSDRHGVVLFEPATGSTHRAAIDDFRRAWSGRYLRLQTRDFGSAVLRPEVG